MIRHVGRLLVALAVAGLLLVSAQAQEQDAKLEPAAKKEQNAKAKIGEPMRDFVLKDVMRELKEGETEADAMVSLASFKGKKPVVLFFLSYTCPVTWKYETRIGKLKKEFGKDVQWLAVKCHAGENVEQTRKFVQARNFDMPVLLDAKNELSRYLDVVATPGFAVIDKDGILRYVGAFDDNADEAAVKKSYVTTALAAIKEGKPFDPTRTPIPG